MRYVYYVFAFLCVLTISVLGFRGNNTTKPPLEVFPDMDRQAKFRPQAPSAFFADGRADRPLPPGVVARGRSEQSDPAFLRTNDHLYTGKTANGQWARGFPAELTIDAQFMERGRHNYTIYCAPCHGALGDGKGIVTNYGWPAPANFHSDALRQREEGELYNTIANGKNTMFPYGDKIAAEDRWAVVAYLRALQRAQNATAADVPPAHKSELGL